MKKGEGTLAYPLLENPWALFCFALVSIPDIRVGGRWGWGCYLQRPEKPLAVEGTS